MSDRWESGIVDLLCELSASQGEFLELLGEKQRMLARGDNDALLAMQSREESLAARLHACHERRQQLLAQAADVGLPADSILSLTESLPEDSRAPLQASVRDARRQARLLQHQSLANWVVIQRMLLHLSQMIEIIATGGHMKPTYGEERTTGALIDRAV